MDTTKHDINTLFKQLGLPSSEAEIDTFIAAQSLAEDGDWSEVIDELDVRLRQQ